MVPYIYQNAMIFDARQTENQAIPFIIICFILYRYVTYGREIISRLYCKYKCVALAVHQKSSPENYTRTH